MVSVFAASVATSFIALALGSDRLALYLIVPALLLSALVLLGHVVTLDDDAAGGWSNPDATPELWRASLRELALKLVALGAVGTAAIWLLFRGP